MLVCYPSHSLLSLRNERSGESPSAERPTFSLLILSSQRLLDFAVKYGVLCHRLDRRRSDFRKHFEPAVKTNVLVVCT